MRDALINGGKYALIGTLLFFGISFSYDGMGTNIPVVDLPGIRSYGVVVGIAFVIGSLMVARFWKDRPSGDARA